MWQLAIILNMLIMLLFWFAGYLVTAPGFNHFVQYPEVFGKLPLPVLTDMVFEVRIVSLVVPGFWAISSLVYLLWLRTMDRGRRQDWVQLHFSATLFVGLLFFVLFLTAGILPYLKIGALID